MYDATGVIGLKYDNNTYLFEKNLQGDIVGIIDSSNERVATYEYDVWGKVLGIKDADGNEVSRENHVGVINLFRYRGYYYDIETGLYYLNSRYYNPEWCRAWCTFNWCRYWSCGCWYITCIETKTNDK